MLYIHRKKYRLRTWILILSHWLVACYSSSTPSLMKSARWWGGDIVVIILTDRFLQIAGTCVYSYCNKLLYNQTYFSVCTRVMPVSLSVEWLPFIDSVRNNFYFYYLRLLRTFRLLNELHHVSRIFVILSFFRGFSVQNYKTGNEI